MRQGYYLRAVVVFLCLYLFSCSPSFSPIVSESETNNYELVIAKELDILDAAAVAIQNCFPSGIISRLSGREKGYTFNTKPLLDWPTYKFLIQKAYGIAPDGNDIVGYQYSIYSDGQSTSPESSDVQTLITEFKKILADKGIGLIQVQRIKNER